MNKQIWMLRLFEENGAFKCSFAEVKAANFALATEAATVIPFLSKMENTIFGFLNLAESHDL